MELRKLEKNKVYKIINIKEADDSLRRDFFTMGFHEGEDIRLIRSAPIFKDPMLFEVQGTKIALTRFEASHLVLEEGSLQ